MNALNSWTWNLTITITILCLGVINSAFSQNNKPTPYFDFKGKMLVSVSDADMIPSAYSDGKLGKPDGTDALSIIRLDGGIPQKMKAVEIMVSNSVTGPPTSLTVTPDGVYAIVIESRGSLPKGKTYPLLKDLEVGKMITVIDLSNADKPTVVQKIEGIKGFQSPQSVSINSKGTLVAITFKPEDSSKQMPLVMYQFQNGKLSSPVVPTIPDWVKGDQLIDAAFHPKENKIALLNLTKAEVSFAEVEENNGTYKLVAWGNKVETDRVPFKIVYTPDASYVLINSLISYGTVSVIKLALSTHAADLPTHELVSKASTPRLPEGLTISPDGRWVVTTNLEMSWPALDDAKQGFFSSITLLSLNPETGLLKHIGDYPFDGLIPEAAVFDNSSQFLAVTSFSHYDETKRGGSIDFWRLSKDYNDPTRVEMVKTNYSVQVTRGVHSLVIVR